MLHTYHSLVWFYNNTEMKRDCLIYCYANNFHVKQQGVVWWSTPLICLNHLSSSLVKLFQLNYEYHYVYQWLGVVVVTSAIVTLGYVIDHGLCYWTSLPEKEWKETIIFYVVRWTWSTIYEIKCHSLLVPVTNCKIRLL